MHPPTHLAISWLIGHRLADRHDRRLVAWSGVAPDLDGLTIFLGAAAYSEYHHVVAHGIVAAVVGTAIWTAFAHERRKVLLFSLAAFHVHLICDLLGSGRDWPIVYWYPFSRREFLNPYGWPLASPQNGFVWLAAMAAILWIGIKHGRTFAESFLPARADAAIVKALRKTFRRNAPRPTSE